MKIYLGDPFSFSEIGRKDNQEDYLLRAADNCFILCDGMGGHENGEVASRLVAETLGREFVANLSRGSSASIGSSFDEALGAAYDALDAADTSDSPRKMGTTMTCVAFTAEGVFTAHIGDSRIYQVRPSLAAGGRNGIIYQSEDHSLVNDLLRAGEITEAEARDFPQKNVITRAMQPHQERRSKADTYLITDVKAGDYFFLCCDGVLEQLTNDKLGEILASQVSDKEKLAAIKAVCDGNTRDNYSCWLIPVKEVEDYLSGSSNASDELQATVEPEALAGNQTVTKAAHSKTPKRRDFGKTFLFASCFALLAIGAGYLWLYQPDGREGTELQETDTLVKRETPVPPDTTASGKEEIQDAQSPITQNAKTEAAEKAEQAKEDKKGQDDDVAPSVPEVQPVAPEQSSVKPEDEKAKNNLKGKVKKWIQQQKEASSSSEPATNYSV